MSQSIANKGSVPEWMPHYKYNPFDLQINYIHLELVAIAQKLDKIDSSGKSNALDKDHADLQAKISQTRDLLATADTEVKVGDDAKDIVKLLQDMKSDIAEVKDKQDKQCCTIS